ncbi:hypothetical protein QZH41_013450 [Actinostola sp. cb2023]|nr:hypothetical protein QZH41_013450 [Actinostola sp. cb2023]
MDALLAYDSSDSGDEEFSSKLPAKSENMMKSASGKMIQNFPHKEFVTCVQLYPSDPNLFLSGTSRNGIYCWDIREHKVQYMDHTCICQRDTVEPLVATTLIVSTYQAPFGQVQDIAFLPGGEQFISAAEVLRRNSTDKGIMEAFTCTCLKVHPSGSFFAAQSNANYIALFATQRPYKLNKYKRYEGHQVSAYVVGFDFSPDGSLVVSGSADGKMYIYNSRTSRCISSLPVNSSVCMDTSYHPSLPSTVATCGFDGQIAILV